MAVVTAKDTSTNATDPVSTGLPALADQSIPQRLGFCNITLHEPSWTVVTTDETVRRYAWQLIKKVLGDEISKMPLDSQRKILNLYFLYLKGEAQVCGNLPTPIQRIINHGEFIENVKRRMEFHHALFTERAQRFPNLPPAKLLDQDRCVLARDDSVVDDCTKSDKFVDVIRGMPVKLEPNSVYRDVGGGAGDMARHIANTFGIKDPKIYEVAQYAENQCEIIRYREDNSIPEADNSVDFATMNMVLHHVQDPDRLFDELHRVLKPSAIFLMRETDTMGRIGIEAFQQFMDYHWYKCNEHSSKVQGVPLRMHFRDGREVHELAERHGFELLEIKDHPKDQGNVFHSRFFCFRCVK